MNNEYITKAQAIYLAESLRPIAGNGITDAFINGIEVGKDAWISTKDRLPEVRKDVIIHHKECGVFEAFFTDDGYWETDSGWWSRQKEVTHWMPLPKPPKE